MMCRQRNCTVPAVDPIDDPQYCARHAARRWLCAYSLREADSLQAMKNWLEEYVLPQAMDDLE